MTRGGALRGIGLAMLLALAALPPVHAQSGCQTGACVTVGPRLASVDSTQGALLNVLLQALLPGSNVNVSVLDWNALAASDINLNLLLTQLGTNLGVSDTQQVLDTDITLAQLQLALVQVAQADGNTALVNALQALPLGIPGLSDTIRLGDLLTLDFPQGALADVDVDVLDFLTGAVQLYNYDNVLVTTSPVVVDTAALGLPGIASLSLWARVVEPPEVVCGGSGSQFHTAAIRIKLDLELTQGLDLQPLLDALNAAALGLANVTLSADVLRLQVYADVARAEGTIGTIDAIAGSVQLEARPGVAGLYIGEIADAVFFNRTATITEAVVQPVQLTTLDLDFNVGIGLLTATVSAPLAVNVRAAATGATGMQAFVVTAPYPRTVSVPCGTACAGVLVTSLLQDLEIDVVPGTIVATLPGGIPVALPTAILDGIVGTLEGALRNVVVPVLEPLLATLLGGLVDPVLGLLGVRIGEMVVTVESVLLSCPVLLSAVLEVLPDGNPALFGLEIALDATVLASAADLGNGGSIGPVDAEPGASYDLSSPAGTGTDLAHYASSWRCADQDDVEIGSGTGSSFSLLVPEDVDAALTITCTITQRQRQADLSVSKANGVDVVLPGSSGEYTIIVANAGPDAVVGATLTDQLPPGITLSAPWTCVATPGSACQAASGGVPGEQALVSVQLDLEVGGQATIVVPVDYNDSLADF